MMTMLWFLLCIFFYLHNTQGWVLIPWQTIWDCQGKRFPINISLSFKVGFASNYDVYRNFFLYHSESINISFPIKNKTAYT